MVSALVVSLFGCSNSSDDNSAGATTSSVGGNVAEATDGQTGGNAGDGVNGDGAAGNAPVENPQSQPDVEGETPSSDSEIEACASQGTCADTNQFSGSRVAFAELDDMDLSGVDFSAATIEGAVSFRGANLTNANFTDAVLRGVDATGANLTKANFTNAFLIDVRLTDANMTDAVLDGVMWCRVTMPDGSDRSEDC